ncbi:ATP-binding protein [Nannocystis pusilla]
MPPCSPTASRPWSTTRSASPTTVASPSASPPSPENVDPWLELRVSDTGVGIAAGDLSRLFVAFQPLDDAPTRAQEGSGVSLALAHRFARLLGGDINVVSAPGRGSTFVLRVPAPRE